MEYEEYIKGIKDKKHEEYIAASSARCFFPFTQRCPQYNKTCLGESCDTFKDGQCLHFEVNRLMYRAFGRCGGWLSFNIDTEDGWFHWIISEGRFYPEKKGEKHRIGFSVGTENRAITLKVLNEVNLGEYFKENYRATVFFPEEFESLPKIQKFLELLKEKSGELEKLFIAYHTCVRCHTVDECTNFYDPFAVCDECRDKITEEWLEEHNPKEM